MEWNGVFKLYIIWPMVIIPVLHNPERKKKWRLEEKNETERGKYGKKKKTNKKQNV